MYRIEFTASFSKDFKKLTHEVQREIFSEWIPRLQQNPDIGERMKGKSLKRFLKLAFRFKKNDYRIVYEIYRKEILVVLIVVGSRENFYKRLERRL